jgi:hypothetical protein
MKWPKGTPRHEIAPAEWRHTPNFTGSYELDAVIHRNPNPDLKHRMAFYGGDGGTVYGQKTGYNGYDGYNKDD